MTRTVRERAGLVVPVVRLAFAAAAGCAGRDDDDAATEAAEDTGDGVDSAVRAPADEDADVEATDEAAADAAGGEGGEGGAAGEGEEAVPLAVDTMAVARARDVVRTGTMRLTVGDVDAGVRRWQRRRPATAPAE